MKLVVALIGTILISTLTFGQKKGTVETKMHVEGICGMCETRIEETVNFSKGIKSAEWDKETGTLTVVYKEGKTTPQKIGELLAKAGHDNEYAKATDKEYEKLSNCCRYKTQEKH